MFAKTEKSGDFPGNKNVWAIFANMKFRPKKRNFYKNKEGILVSIPYPCLASLRPSFPPIYPSCPPFPA
jgi:hypothetical protein